MTLNKDLLLRIGKAIFFLFGAFGIVLVAFALISGLRGRIQEGSYMDSGSPLTYNSEVGSNFSLGGIPSSSEDYKQNSVDSDMLTDSSKEIKTGDISIVVDDLEDAIEEFDTIKEKYSGDITYSYEGGEGSDKYIDKTLKIKSSDFEAVFEEISDMTGDVDYSNTRVSDVTEQYVELEARLKNLEAVEDQLVKIMATADTVEDTLAVYAELSSTRSEIEVLKAEIRYMDNQTDYSYINVTISLSSLGADLTDESWKPLGVVKEAFRTFLVFLEWIANILIWILVFSPIVLVGGGIYLVIRNRSKKTVE